MGGGSLLEGRNRLADEVHEDDRAEDGRHSLKGGTSDIVRYPGGHEHACQEHPQTGLRSGRL